MAIRFACDACGRAYELPEAAIGRQAKCECGEMLVVPAKSTLVIPPPLPPATASKPSPAKKEERPPRTLHQAAEVARKKREAEELNEAKLAAMADESEKSKADRQAAPPEVPPNVPPLPPTFSVPTEQPSPGARGYQSNRGKSERGYRSLLLLLFDLKLKRYLTPYLLRLIWWATLLVAGLFLVSYMSSAILEKPFTSQIVGQSPNPFAGQLRGAKPVPDSSMSDLFFELLGRLLRFGIFAYFLTVAIISVRITLELCIVLFNIAETLEKIESQGKTDPPAI